jgi:hypothetical protein
MKYILQTYPAIGTVRGLSPQGEVLLVPFEKGLGYLRGGFTVMLSLLAIGVIPCKRSAISSQREYGAEG